MRRKRSERIGDVVFALRFPPRIADWALEGMLHTPEQDPGCEIPADNSGTVTVEANVDGEGKHHVVRTTASGTRIDGVLVQGLAALVRDSWHSDPPRTPDGAAVDLLDGERIRLTVEFPILAAAGAGR